MAFFDEIFTTFRMYAPSLHDLVDIILLTIVIYFILKLTQETRAFQVLKGFGLFVVGYQICQWLNLSGMSWLLGYAINNFALLLIVIFAPQLRQAMEQIGRGQMIRKIGNTESAEQNAVNAIVAAAGNMSSTKTGALMVLQRSNPLGDIIESGTVLNAEVSAPLLENIFVPNTPLHDGAVIIRGNTILAAACILPLTSNTDLSQDLGTRHRAALGISEDTDALIVVVSEETGTISVAENGRLVRYLDEDNLREILMEAFVKENGKRSVFARINEWRKLHVRHS